MNTLNLIKKANYVIVELNRGKVNAIDGEMTAELTQVFRDLDKDETVKGVILSGRPHCFSAGLDVMSLAGSNSEDIKEFWRNYLGALQALIEFSKPLVCAITGYAPAGATIFALCCDYRIMGKGAKHVVGMHEFKMSMLIPKMMCDVYAWHLGERVAWDAVLNERLFNSDQALAIGLVNESVEVEEVLERAEQQLQKYMRVYGPTYAKSKVYLKKGLLDIAKNADIEEMVSVIAEDTTDPGAMAAIQQFLVTLKSK